MRLRVQTYQVQHSRYELRTAKDRRQYLLAVYSTADGFAYRECVFFGYHGLPGRKAAAWWSKRSPHSSVPSTASEAINRTTELMAPKTIDVRLGDGRWPEIVSATFATPEPQTRQLTMFS